MFRFFFFSFFSNFGVVLKEYKTFCQENNLSVLLNGVRSICLSPLSLYVSFTSLFLTPYASSRSFHRVCVSEGLLEEKKEKEKQEGTYNCQAPLIETARSFGRVREEGRERDALRHVCLTPAGCVCIRVCSPETLNKRRSSNRWMIHS